jgi:hypothetical protein
MAHLPPLARAQPGLWRLGPQRRLRVNIFKRGGVRLGLLGGKVRYGSPNAACVTGRKVTLYRTNRNVLGSTTTGASGRWMITASGSAGITLGHFFAKVKRRSEGTAGTIFVCKGGKSALEPGRRDGPTIPIGFEWLPASGRGRALGTVVAVEDGPGYPSTGSIVEYRGIFGPLLRDRNLLLVDNRGTGRSALIRCPRCRTCEPSCEASDSAGSTSMATPTDPSSRRRSWRASAESCAR